MSKGPRIYTERLQVPLREEDFVFIVNWSFDKFKKRNKAAVLARSILEAAIVAEKARRKKE